MEMRHAPGEAMKNFNDLSRDLEFPMGIGLPGRVWQEGVASDVVARHELDSSFARGQAAVAAGLVGAFAFPITIGKESAG